jgi:4-hydroxybenzoate polyprenyltransferase
MLNNLRKLLLVSRPISWPNTAYPFAAAYLVTGGSLDVLFWVATLYFLIPYNLLMYGVNDVFDYESDMQNPRKGGIEGAREQKTFHPIILWTATLLNIPFVLYLILQGAIISSLIFAGLTFFVLAYSLKYLRFKEIPILDSITSSVHFVGPMVYALSLTGFMPEYTPYIAAFFLWGIASHAFGAVQDIIPDRAGGLSSIATVFGARHTTRIVFILYLAASILVAAQGGISVLVGVTGLIYVANVFPYLNVNDKRSAETNTGWRRFIWLNLFTGFIITISLIFTFILI